MGEGRFPVIVPSIVWMTTIGVLQNPYVTSVGTDSTMLGTHAGPGMAMLF